MIKEKDGNIIKNMMEILKWVAIRQLVKMKKSIKKFKGVNITQNKPFQ